MLQGPENNPDGTRGAAREAGEDTEQGTRTRGARRVHTRNTPSEQALDDMVINHRQVLGTKAHAEGSAPSHKSKPDGDHEIHDHRRRIDSRSSGWILELGMSGREPRTAVDTQVEAVLALE